MSDFRIRYLKFLEARAVIISFVSVVVLFSIAIPGLVLETEDNCVSRLRLWLVGITVRAFLRLLILWRLSRVLSATEPSFHAFRACHIWLETLDVVGAVWFILLNVIVLDNITCYFHSPIIYCACLVYLAGAYIYFGVFYAVVISLVHSPPSSHDDSQYLHNRRQASAARFVNQSNRAGVSSNHDIATSEGWTKWLETYGSYQVNYSKDMKLSDLCGRDKGGRSTSTSNTERNINDGIVEIGVDIEVGESKETRDIIVDQNYGATGTENNNENNSENQEADYCTICLQPFEQVAPTATVNPIVSSSRGAASSHSVDENCSVIVRYPCHGNHYFHAHCLHRWLEVSSVAHASSYRIVMSAAGVGDIRKLVTCPICREHPSLPQTSEG